MICKMIKEIEKPLVFALTIKVIENDKSTNIKDDVRNVILMNVTFGIQCNKKANCIGQHFVAIPATSSGQLNVKCFLYMLI